MSRKREPFYEVGIAGHGTPRGTGDMSEILTKWIRENIPGEKEIHEQNKERIERSKKAGRSARG